MERFEVDMTVILGIREELRAARPGSEEPLPGSYVKLDDQLFWLGCVPAHVLWRGDSDEEFIAYTPDLGMDRVGLPAGTRGEWIYDRAPVDPSEPPLPIYPPLEPPPEQQVQQVSDDRSDDARQMGGERTAHRKKPSLQDERRALDRVLDKLTPEQRDRAEALIRSNRPELLKPNADKPE